MQKSEKLTYLWLALQSLLYTNLQFEVKITEDPQTVETITLHNLLVSVKWDILIG